MSVNRDLTMRYPTGCLLGLVAVLAGLNAAYDYSWAARTAARQATGGWEEAARVPDAALHRLRPWTWVRPVTAEVWTIRPAGRLDFDRNLVGLPVRKITYHYPRTETYRHTLFLDRARGLVATSDDHPLRLAQMQRRYRESRPDQQEAWRRRLPWRAAEPGSTAGIILARFR